MVLSHWSLPGFQISSLLFHYYLHSPTCAGEESCNFRYVFRKKVVRAFTDVTINSVPVWWDGKGTVNLWIGIFKISFNYSLAEKSPPIFLCGQK